MRTITGVALGWLSCVIGSLPTQAQGWPPWADDIFGDRGWRYERSPRWAEPERESPRRDHRPSTRTEGNEVRDGGARPHIAPIEAPIVSFPYDFPARSIVIDTGGRKLYYVLGDNRAYTYPISVGREGFNWTGTETVSRKQAWPDWHPPAEMRERDASLPEKMTGGIKNPLGAMALYLGDTLYRIHGTNDVKSIGRAESSGCFRMMNSAVLHLASLTDIGTTVSVVTSLPASPQVSRAEERPPLPESKPAPQGLPAAAPPPPSKSSDAFRNYQALRDFTLATRP
jgi:lipoprotein-anchoring transpeptidase ErfK/SrfK